MRSLFLNFETVPVENQLHILPTMTNVELLSSTLSEKYDMNITVGTLKQLLSKQLAIKYGWNVSPSDIVMESDDVILYDSWRGHDFGLGEMVKDLTYRCLTLSKKKDWVEIETVEMENKQHHTKGNTTGKTSSSNNDIEASIHNAIDNATTALSTKDKRNKTMTSTSSTSSLSKNEREEILNTIKCNLQELKLSSNKIKSSVGITFKQVSRDLEVFVLHILNIVQQSKPTASTTATVNQTNENKTAMTLPKTNTMEVASADSSGGGGGSSSVGGVRVVCALFEDEADNVNNVLVTSVDERILRVGQSTVRSKCKLCQFLLIFSQPKFYILILLTYILNIFVLFLKFLFFFIGT
jgi:hypothetical protein